MIMVFMEYKVKPDTLQTYEQKMKLVNEELLKCGAQNFEWYKAIDQGALYVECFTLLDQSSYEEIKLARTSEEHPVFSEIHPFIEGGKDKIHCWAFEKLNVKDNM